MTAGAETDVLLSAGDIARLSGVRRPAVSNWRRRYPDFPGPMGGTATHPLFAWDEVETWCDLHKKPFHPSPADRIWQRAETVVGGSRMGLFLAHMGLRLTSGTPSPHLPPAETEWEQLLTETVQARDPAGLYAGVVARFHETWARQDDEVSAPIAQLMVEITEVPADSTVLDPSCGTGTLAAAAVTAGANRVLLQEHDPVRATITQAQLLLRGTENQLIIEDALHDDGFANQAPTVDTVLCAPREDHPSWNREAVEMDPRWSYGLPPRGESELAWVQHCLALVRTGGRVAVRLPATAAKRRSGRRIRANLLRAGVLRAVVDVPRHLAEETHLWLLSTAHSPRPTRLLTVADPPDTATVVAAWRRFCADPDGEPGRHAAHVPLGDLLDHDVELTPGAPQDGAQVAQSLHHLTELRAELLHRLAELPRAPELGVSTSANASDIVTTSVATLAAQGRLELLRAPTDMPGDTGEHPVLTTADLRQGSAPSGRCEATDTAVVLHEGDIIVPPRDEARPRVARPSEYGAGLGAGLALLRPLDPSIDPEFLAGFLAEQPQQRRRSTGQSRARTAELPVLSAKQQRAYGATLRQLAELEEQLTHLAEVGSRWAAEARRALRTGIATPEEPTDAG